MGNSHSLWHRSRSHSMDNETEPEREEAAAPITNSSDQTASISNSTLHFQLSDPDASRPPPRYSLRRTLARLQRSLGHHSTTDLDSTVSSGTGETSLSSNTHLLDNNSNRNILRRRRRREEIDWDGFGSIATPIDLDSIENEIEREARRRRIEQVSRAAFTPPPPNSYPTDTPLSSSTGLVQDTSTSSQYNNNNNNEEPDSDQGDATANSMLFYFSLPSEFAASPTTPRESTSSTHRRRSSSRLQRAANYFRERWNGRPYNNTNTNGADDGRSSNTTLADNPSTGEGDGENSLDRPMVLVRIRQLPIGNGSIPGASNNNQSSNLRNDPSSNLANNLPNNQDSTTIPPTNTMGNDDGSVSSVFQWTIYFVIPRTADRANRTSQSPSNPTTSVPPGFDTDGAIRRAFAILRAMMSGENMGYEEWLRLQEMLGMVPRGVAKELIEEQLPAQPYVTTLGIGLNCPICLEEYLVGEGEGGGEKVRILPCTHSYHVQCIDTWLASYNNCPLCRQPPVQVDSPS